MRFTIFTFFAVLLSSTFCAQAKMYKWVDENGQMHFGDRIPEKYLTKEHDELNEQGFKTKHREAAKTSEEKAEVKRLKQEREKAALAEEKKRKLDRVLLDAYDSERDLIAARDSRLEAVAVQIQLAESIINNSNKKIGSIEQQVTEIRASNRKVPDDLYKSIDIEKEQVKVHGRALENYKKRSDEIAAQYNDYIERFRAAKSH
jgi:hypothetical protein